MTDIGDLTGKQLDHFKIQRKLGAGGMAVVYKAHEMSLNRTVALKVIGSHLMEDPSFVERFQREAQAAARINHPNIVQIYSIGEDDGHHYFAMEYIDGKSLEEVIDDEGFLTVPKALPVVRQVAAALAEAHEQDVVHRDIKPANIMIDGSGRVKVADFGIAFMQTEAARLTQEGAWVGTPKYVSPEQCRGEAVDGRSDIYSLGVTLYETLSGRAPFDADTPAGLVMQIVKGESEPIERVNPTVPGEVGSLIGRMIALDPADRFQSAEDLVLEIEQMEKKGLTTASHQVHPDADEEPLPATVALGPDDDEDVAESPAEAEDRQPAATEVLQTEPGTGSGDDAERSPPATEAAAPTGAEDAAAATRSRDASPPAPDAPQPGSVPTHQPPPSAGAAGGGETAAPASPAADERSSRWSKMGLAAAAVVILALIGVVFAVQQSGASRPEAPAPEEETAVADAEAPAPEESTAAEAAGVDPATSAGAGDEAGSAETDATPERSSVDAADAGEEPGRGSGERAAAEDLEPTADAEQGDSTAEAPAATADADAPAADEADGSSTDAATAAAAGEESSGASGAESSGAAGAASQPPAGQAERAASAGSPAESTAGDPAPALPPAGSIVVQTTAEGNYGEFIHSRVERQLLQEDFDVVDAGSFPGERMADLARILLEPSVSITDRERVDAYGISVDRVTVSLGLRAVSLVDGRTLATMTDTVTYTPSDAEQKLDAAVFRLMRDMVREIRERTED